MRTFAVYLILAAVTLRTLVDLEGYPNEGRILSLVIPFGVLLAAEPWLIRQLRTKNKPGRYAYPVIYLLIQIFLVMELLLIPPHQDTFLALFIPISLQAVLFFGRRVGFLWICAFPLAMIPWLIAEPEFSNFVMAFTFEGLYFLLGVYADLIQRAESARRENLRLADELQDAHQRLQEYALQVEDLAAERERYHLARELHDSVTQTVFSMNLTTQTARLLYEKNPGGVTAQLDRLQELAGSAMGEIQKLVAQLRPRPVTEEGLAATLKRMITERRTLEGLEVHLECSGEDNLPEPVVVGLFSIVQEALTNVVKHAGTRQATVRLCLDAAPAYIEIEDQGVGFDPGSSIGLPGHLGLAEMAERASEIGWRLSIEAQPARGTRIRIER